MNWTAVTKRLMRAADEAAAPDLRAGEPSMRPLGEQDPAELLTGEGTDGGQAPSPLRASSVRAFTPRDLTPRDLHVPRHRANVPTDSVGDRPARAEHQPTGIAATA